MFFGKSSWMRRDNLDVVICRKHFQEDLVHVDSFRKIEHNEIEIDSNPDLQSRGTSKDKFATSFCRASNGPMKIYELFKEMYSIILLYM